MNAYDITIYGIETTMRELFNPYEITIDAEERRQLGFIADKAHRLSTDKESYLHDQALDMLVHFMGFIDEQETSFSRYFMISDDCHKVVHDTFLNETIGLFGEPIISDFGKAASVKQLVFPEERVALIARTDYTLEGSPAGINYHAERMPDIPRRMLGDVAEALGMQ